MNQKKKLLNIIADKTAIHICAFDVVPDIMIVTKEQYELVKDSSYVATLRVIFEENIKSPILLRK